MEELGRPIRLIKEDKKVIGDEKIVYRIETTEYHKTIKPGTRGGYAASENSVDETSWIFDDSIVMGKGVRLINGTIIQDNSKVGEGASFIDGCMLISNCNITGSTLLNNYSGRIRDISFIKDTRITKERVYLNGRCSLVNCVIERDFAVFNGDADTVNLFSSHLVDSVIISPDRKIVLNKSLASSLRVVVGSIGITAARDLIGSVTLKDVTITGKGSSIDGHLLGDINLLKNVEVKGGCTIDIMEGSAHIENRLFEGVGDSINHKYEDNGNLIML